MRERRREWRARHEPDAFGLVLHEGRQLGRGGARSEKVCLIDDQPVRLEVAQEARREGHVGRREQNVAIAQLPECGSLLSGGVVVDTDDERRRKLAKLVGPLSAHKERRTAGGRLHAKEQERGGRLKAAAVCARLRFAGIAAVARTSQRE